MRLRIGDGFLLFFALALIACSMQAQQKPAPRTSDYMLDESPLGIAIYSGLAYRSYIGPKDRMENLKELEDRVAQLPAGTKLHWMPYKRDRTGKPTLFSAAEKYVEFAKFCGDRKIDLVITPLATDKY
jgi:hypothetical protein